MKGLFVLCAVAALALADPTINKDIFCHIRAVAEKAELSIGGTEFNITNIVMTRVNGYSRLDVYNGEFVSASVVMRPDKGTYFASFASGSNDCSAYDNLVVTLDNYQYVREESTSYLFRVNLPNSGGVLDLYVNKQTGLPEFEELNINVMMYGYLVSVHVYAEYDQINADFKLEDAGNTFMINSLDCPNAAYATPDAVTTKCNGGGGNNSSAGHFVFPSVLSLLILVALLLF